VQPQRSKRHGLREIGYRPFAVGLLSALLVSLASLALILCLY
jgi:hypothetical protein